MPTSEKCSSRSRSGGIQLESEDEEEEAVKTCTSQAASAKTAAEAAEAEAAKKAALDALFLAELGMATAPQQQPRHKAIPAAGTATATAMKKAKVMEFRMPGAGRSVAEMARPAASGKKREITKSYDFAGETVKWVSFCFWHY